MVVRSLVTSLIAFAGLLAWAPQASAELVMVRVVGENVMVKTRPSRIAETLAKPLADTVLEVLSREGSWFWVLVERDSHGTQRAGWVRESDVEFVDSAVARFFPPPAPPPPARSESPTLLMPPADEVAADAALAGETPAETTAAVDPAAAAVEKLQAEETRVADAKPAQAAKVEKPKKVDDRKLKKAAAEYEKALQAYEKIQFRTLLSDQPLQPVGEPIIEPLYSLPN
jgi:hypothetical protein